MTTTATNSGKSYLGVDNRAVVTNIDTLFARLNALSSLTWGDVLDNGAQASQDLDLNGHIATGANRIEADSLEAARAEITDSLLVRGDADFASELTVGDTLVVSGPAYFTGNQVNVSSSLSVANGLSVTNGIVLNSGGTLSGAYDVSSSNIIAHDSLLVGRMAWFADARATGDVQIDSELAVGDTLRAAAPALFADSVHMDGNLSIDGDVHLAGDLYVSGLPVDFSSVRPTALLLGTAAPTTLLAG